MDTSLGYVCPWSERCILTKPGANMQRRRIIGQASGKYSYVSVHPSGRSIAIKDAKCSKGTQDVVQIDRSYSKVTFTASEGKRIDLHLAERLSAK